MGDDGQVNVPLPFSFPFYGQTFNNSWMYDNGVVSFKQPDTQGALSPWQWSSQPFSNQMGSSYFISPLWADIAPKWGTTNYSTTTDGTFMRYKWDNISEYYSGGTRLSTFSLTIRPDGTFSSNYSGLNLNTSNTSVGYVGDPTKGEYTQVYYAPFGTNIQNGTISNWSGATTPPPPQYPAQCTTNPLFSTECPGYAQALALQNATPTTTTTTVTSPTAPVVSEPTQTTATPTVVAAPAPSTTVTEPVTNATPTVTSSPVNNASATSSTPSVATTASPTANNPQPKVGEVAQSGGSSSKSNVSTSQILSIVATEQSRVSSVEKSAVEQTTQQANAVASSVTQQAESVASQSQSQSIATSIQAGQISSQNAIGGSNNQSGFSINAQSVVNASIASYGQPQNDLQQGNNTGLRLTESQITNENIVLASRTPQAEDNSRFDNTRQTTSTPDRTLIEQNQVTQQPEVRQNAPMVSVNQRVRDNELAGGVSLTSIVKQPTGFELYMAAIPDVKFYAPKEVYRGQRNVDNARLLRGLTRGSDDLHQQMINQQYK